MGSFSRTSAGIGAATLVGAALTAAPAAAQPIVRVPCNPAALAIAVSNANSKSATLLLAARCNYAITGTLSITGNVTLLGGTTTTISAGATGFRILDVSSTGTLRVQRIFITGATTTTPLEEGAGIQNAGSLVLDHVTLSGNTATGGNGGGLANTATGHASVVLSVISSNKATFTGGPTGAGGGILNRGDLTLSRSRLIANDAGDGGGGIDTLGANATSRIVQSTIENNTGDTIGGGGIFNSGTTSLDRSLVTGNKATGVAGQGGGIYKFAGTVTLTNSIVRMNDPNNCFPPGSIPGCVG